MNEIGVYEAMSTLRAVRRLKPDPIPEPVLNRVLEAATWAPTGSNAQPWRIVVVREPAAKQALGAWYGEEWKRFAARYRRLVSAMPDEQAAKARRTIRSGDYLGEHFADSPAILVFCFNPALMAITDAGLDRPCVVGGASIYTAVENVLLACRAEGLGCTLTTLLCTREAQVKETLAIPDGWGTAAFIPIGYPQLRGHGPISRRSVGELVYNDRWKQAYE